MDEYHYAFISAYKTRNSSVSHDNSSWVLIFGKKDLEEKMAQNCILLLSAISALQVAQAGDISILISLPLHPTSGPSLSWERGYEILPGALQAVNDINNDSTILPGHNLRPIVIDSPQSDDIEIVQQFVNLTFYHSDLRLNDIFGVTGVLIPRAVSILMPLVRRERVLLSAITHTDQLPDDPHSGTFLPLPSPSAIVGVLLNFMNQMTWQRIGVITDSTDAYFFNVAEKLLQVTKKNDSIIIMPYIELTHTSPAIQEINKLNTRIVFVSLNAERAIQLLCTVREKGLVWPKYAWIFHSFEVEDLLEQQSSCDNIRDAVDGVFFIDVQPQSDPMRAELISGITSSNYYRQYFSNVSKAAFEYNNITLTSRLNGYAILLYDLVWTMAVALNESCPQLNDSLECLHRASSEATAAADLLQNQWIFSIYHINKLRPLLISAATVHYSNNSITATSFNSSILETAPKGELPIVTQYPPLAYTVILGVQIVLTFIFVTLTLALYICFRKEPEVKATSFALSLLVFLGCYVNLAYLIVLFCLNHTLDSINIPRDNSLCVSLPWLANVGLSLPLMLATLLVKMLRVYHIFNHAKLRLSLYCSDLALALYVFLILMPGIIVNLVWVAIDRYGIYFEYRARGSYLFLWKTCRSNHQATFVTTLSTYLLVLIIAVTFVAVITRNVRLQHFKDTKKVNFVVFIFSITVVVSFSYWGLLRALGTKLYISNLPLHIAHSVFIMCILGFLFVPKVFPPLWRKVKNVFNK